MSCPKAWICAFGCLFVPELFRMDGKRDFVARVVSGYLRLGMAVCDIISSNYSHVFPAHVVWRLWIGLFYFACGENAAETFTLALRKR